MGIESHAIEDVSPGPFWVGGIIEAFFNARIWVARADAERAAELLRDYEQRLEERAPSAVEGKEKIEVECTECHKPGRFPRAHLGTVQHCPHCRALMDVVLDEEPNNDWSEEDDAEPTD